MGFTIPYIGETVYQCLRLVYELVRFTNVVLLLLLLLLLFLKNFIPLVV